jgi:hypothetical protein
VIGISLRKGEKSTIAPLSETPPSPKNAKKVAKKDKRITKAGIMVT